MSGARSGTARYCLAGLVGALLYGMAGHAAAAPLNFCYEDAPQSPWTMPDGTGLNFELLRRVARLTGEQFVFHARPWKRCVEETRAGVMDAMVGPSDAPSRRSFSLPPRLPDGSADPGRAMYTDRFDVFLRAGSGATWDGKALHNPSGVVVAQRGYFTVELLQARGQRVLDSSKSAEDGLRLLTEAGADVAVLQGRAAVDLLRSDSRFQGHIELARQPFSVFHFYLMVARKTYEREPQRIEAIWNAIPVVRATSEYRQLEAAELHQYQGE